MLLTVTISDSPYFVIIITLGIYITFCYNNHDNMLRCLECGTSLNVNSDDSVIDCPECGTEFEINQKTLIGLHLGPSEE